VASGQQRASQTESVFANDSRTASLAHSPQPPVQHVGPLLLLYRCSRAAATRLNFRAASRDAPAGGASCAARCPAEQSLASTSAARRLFGARGAAFARRQILNCPLPCEAKTHSTTHGGGFKDDRQHCLRAGTIKASLRRGAPAPAAGTRERTLGYTPQRRWPRGLS
jgi:hypothetical protein